MAIPIIHDWEKYFANPHEGLGSSYERIVLNSILKRIAAKYGVTKALESPSFGFTGISGINLLDLAKQGVEVTLEDNDQSRLDQISGLWKQLGRPLNAVFNPDFRSLQYSGRHFDLSFSFSALWFTPDIRLFLSELGRVTDKVILLSVPNREGWGYKMQIKDYSPAKYPEVQLGNIDPASIQKILAAQDWKLVESGFFDCPPWPDIGMTKEDLLCKLLPGCPVRKRLMRRPAKTQKTVSILEYYRGNDAEFPMRMMKYNWLEKMAPVWFKRLWAHHYYMVFVRKD